MSRRRSSLWIAPILCVMVAGSTPGEAQDAAPRAEPEPRLELPRSTRVEGIRVFLRNAGRVDWALQGDRIAFDRRGDDGFYDLYLTDSEGRSERCLTCGFPELRKAHAFDPVFHPSGRFVFLQVQPIAHRLKLDTAAMTTPDRGLATEIWVLPIDGSRYWRLTRRERTGGALLGPVVSFEGDRLAWAERESTKAGRWGDWLIRVARFTTSRGTPRLGKVETLRFDGQPTVVIPGGFLPDDERLLFSASFEGSPGDLDLYEVALKKGAKPRRVLGTEGVWESGARIARRGAGLVWASDRGVDLLARIFQGHRRPSARAQQRDLWWSTLDGGAQERLTFFNHPASPHFDRGAVVADAAWSPDGSRLVVHLVSGLRSGDEPTESLYLLTLAEGVGPQGDDGR